MANRRFTQFMYSLHTMPVILDCNFLVGSTGAVTAGTVKGPGIYALTRLAVGTYKVQFQDNYNKFFGMTSWFGSPVTGSNVAATALVPGTIYTITALGTTTTANWVTAGVPVGVTPAVGVAFLAAATSSGNGTAKAVGASGDYGIEVVGLPNTTLTVNPSVPGAGYVVVQTLGPTDATHPAQIPIDPASGTTVGMSFYLSNSSNTVQGE